MVFFGQNPPFGARILYHLGARADSVSVAISDAAGTVVRTLRDTTKSGLGAGVNSTGWDLRVEARPPPPPPGRARAGGGGGWLRGGGGQGGACGPPGPLQGGAGGEGGGGGEP